jgi:hypothetical protein
MIRKANQVRSVRAVFIAGYRTTYLVEGKPERPLLADVSWLACEAEILVSNALLQLFFHEVVVAHELEMDSRKLTNWEQFGEDE